MPPPPPAKPPWHPCAGDESGQAAVEFVALLPLAAIVLGLAWQSVLAGQAAWAVTVAARAAARAAALSQDPLPAARARLDPGLARTARVHGDGDGHVTVSVLVPSLVPGLAIGRVESVGSFRRQDGS